MRSFRVAALVEASTYLALLAAVVAHRALGGPDLTSAIGPVHGIAFLAYAFIALLAREERGWGAQRTAGILVAAVVPLGGYVVAHRLAAAPPDRTTATGGPPRGAPPSPDA